MAGAVLHWDFENAPVPRGVSVGRVFGEMRTLIHKRFGPLFYAWAYADPGQLTQPRKDELDAAGLDLINCSRAAGKTNTVDFRIVSRALQDLARPLAPGTTRTAVVVVTGDGDFAYTISALRNVCVPTMLIFDHDRQNTVNARMLEVADFVEPLSFGGAEEEDDVADETIETGSAGGAASAGPLLHDSGAWQAAGAGNPNVQARDEQAFLQAMQLAPPADDEGYRAGTAVGNYFHRLRKSPEPTKQGRQNTFRKVRDALSGRQAIRMRTEVSGVAFFKLLAPPPGAAGPSA